MKKVTRIVDEGKRGQVEHAGEASTRRVSESGLDLKPIGAINAAKQVQAGQPVLVFNSGTSVAYVAFGEQGMAAPTGPADGIPVSAGEKFMLNSGDKRWIRGSAASLYAYTGDNFQD